MFQSKPIQILKTLQGPELRRLGEFLRSPIHNRTEKTLEVFETLRRFHPEYDSPELERSRLFELLFPGEPWDEKKLRYLMTDLAKQLEEFLILLETRKQKHWRQYLLLRSYKARRLDKYFLATHKSASKSLADDNLRDTNHHWITFKLEEILFQFNISRKDHQRSTNLQQVVDSLDIHFLSNKLKYSCEILNSRDWVNVDYELFLLEEIRTYLEDRDLERYPSIAIYYQIMRTLTEPEEEGHYARLLELLEEHRESFNDSEVFDMYIYAKNYCIVKINRGHADYTRQLFEFYRTILNNRIIYKNGQLNQWDFKNIVTLGLRLDEFTWTGKFIEQYAPDLPIQDRDNAYSYNMANLEFSRANYDRTMTLLQEVEFTDVYYHLDSKTLLLKTYYEKEEWDAMQSLIEAFKIYLKRNKLIPAYQRRVYGNLVYFASKLLRARRGRKIDLGALLEEMDERKEIANSEWLRLKVQSQLEDSSLSR